MGRGVIQKLLAKYINPSTATPCCRVHSNRTLYRSIQPYSIGFAWVASWRGSAGWHCYWNICSVLITAVSLTYYDIYHDLITTSFDNHSSSNHKMQPNFLSFSIFFFFFLFLFYTYILWVHQRRLGRARSTSWTFLVCSNETIICIFIVQLWTNLAKEGRWRCGRKNCADPARAKASQRLARICAEDDSDCDYPTLAMVRTP